MFNITEAVTAYSTLFLAIVTTGLAYATYKLWSATGSLVQDARNVSHRELRAYVWACEVNQQPVNAPDIGLDNNCRITVLLENAGQTPTKNLRMNIHWDVFDEKLPQDFAFPESHLPPAAAHIGPGGTVHSRHVDIPNPILSLVARRLRFVYVWGWVDYDDVIDPTTRHRTEYCFEMLMDGDLSSYAMHEQFNAADEDCLRKPASFYD